MPATTITGACGEHYVAAYLSGFDLVVALPRAGTAGSDLFVSKERGGNPLRVQVKTARTEVQRNDKDVGRIYLWATSYDAIDRSDRYLWYAYVWLNGWPAGSEGPELFFVPSHMVAERLRECRDDGDTRGYFWMRVNEAPKYRGSAGLKALLQSLAV